ncbi:hypothetical protein [Brevibacterium sp. CT2-23B]|uniref:hypothetical protein n=1 Tax=Brevibacterium sp. CT2-23B TaxID=2729630 RepID=UPI001554AB33|nr:hypothetical protein [Brevibacterium sp. CT2-23B]
MALYPVPWFTTGGVEGEGGAENYGELARADSFIGSAGATGIIAPTDFKVVQTPTPGAAVRVRKGTGVIASTYPNVFGQSYVVQEQSFTDVPVAATGSSGGATKYVYVLIEDTQYTGQAPVSVENGPYNSYQVTTTLPQFKPYLLLAKIEQPKSTATITNAMITDLREIANPRTYPTLRVNALTSDEAETLTATADAGEWFPNAGGGQVIKIPELATRAIIEAEWLQVNERKGNSYGGIWVEFGPYVTSGVRQYATSHLRWNSSTAGDNARNTWKCADEVYIDPSIRGTEQWFAMKARISYASANAARPQMDNHSAALLKVTFLQVPDPSTS